MSTTSRREALKRVVAGGAGFALMPKVLWGQDSSITIAGRPVADRDRIGEPVDGSHHRSARSVGGVARARDSAGRWSRPRPGRGAGRWRERVQSVRAGDLTVRFNPGPSPSHRRFRRARGEPVQTLTLDAAAADDRVRARQRATCSASAKAGRSSIARAAPSARATARAAISCARTAAACRFNG